VVEALRLVCGCARGVSAWRLQSEQLGVSDCFKEDTAEGGPVACAARISGRAWSRCVFVFVDESVASTGSQQGDGRWWGFGRVIDWCRWSLPE